MTARGASGSRRRTSEPDRSRQAATRRGQSDGSVAARGRHTPRRRPATDAGQPELHPRDRGPVRAFVRDVVDSRRRLVGLLLPVAGVTVTCAFAPRSDLQQYLLAGSLVLLAAVVLDALRLGVDVTRMARARFPDAEIPGVPTALYAFMRAHRSRGARRPPPRVTPG